MNKEKEYLFGMLKRYVAEINETFRNYHAAIDNSGAMPQLYIKKK